MTKDGKFGIKRNGKFSLGCGKHILFDEFETSCCCGSNDDYADCDFIRWCVEHYPPAGVGGQYINPNVPRARCNGFTLPAGNPFAGTYQVFTATTVDYY